MLKEVGKEGAGWTHTRIDFEIAERIMGWNFHRDPGQAGEWRDALGKLVWHENFSPTIDLRATAPVLEMVRRAGIKVFIQGDLKVGWVVCMETDLQSIKLAGKDLAILVADAAMSIWEARGIG